MSALTDARAHLAKAREFLEAADVELSGALYSASTSSSVLAGITRRTRSACAPPAAPARRTITGLPSPSSPRPGRPGATWSRRSAG
jgi:hypothetical protein